MARTHPARRPSAGARRAGYGLAILFSTALLVVLNGAPGWQAIPFLTGDTGQVLWLVNLCLAAGIAANLVYLAYDPPWLSWGLVEQDVVEALVGVHVVEKLSGQALEGAGHRAQICRVGAVEDGSGPVGQALVVSAPQAGEQV